MADITTSRIECGAILIRRNYPGYIDLGEDVIVIPRFIYDWEKFIKENGKHRNIRNL